MPGGLGQAHSGGEQHRSGRADRRAVHPLQVRLQGHCQRCRRGGGGDLQLHGGREAWRVRGGPAGLPVHHQTVHAQVRSRRHRSQRAFFRQVWALLWKNPRLKYFSTSLVATALIAAGRITPAGSQ